MVEDVLETMQSFDPVGVCAQRPTRECLLLQARLLKLENSLVTEIISNHLKNLENKNFKAICKDLKVKDERKSSRPLQSSGRWNPNPEDSSARKRLITSSPDIYVYKSEGDFIIVLNDDGMPKLRVNPFYKQAIARRQEVSDQHQRIHQGQNAVCRMVHKKHSPTAKNDL
jgi:RNA polymerase sigma-54 factor